MGNGKCVSEILKASADFLAAKGVQEPRLAAEWLAARLLKCKRLALPAHGADILPEPLLDAMRRGVIIVDKTQCNTGAVEMGRYATSLNLLNMGVVSAHDCTTEALVAKLMFLLGEYSSPVYIKKLLQKNICGEMTVPE